MGYYFLMRFKSLGTPNAILEHQKIIDKKGFVWAAWWASSDEKLPVDSMHIIDNALKENGSVVLFLADADKHCVYRCNVTNVCYSHSFGEKISSPESDATPEYYSKDQMFIWFCINKIERPLRGLDSLAHYAFADYDVFPTENARDYSALNRTSINSIFLIFIQKRTLMLLRDKEPGDLSGIQWLNNKCNFSKEYSLTNSNSVLLISDLHFSEDQKNFCFADCKQPGVKVSKTLSEAIKSVTSNQPFASLVCVGDITYHASKKGFQKAEPSLFSIINNHGINKDNVIIVPGNHDMSFTDSCDPQPIKDTQDKAKEYYNDFYKKIIGLPPNKFCAIGRKFLLKNRLPVEIVGLNSCALQQEKDHFTGMGYVGDDQLKLVEEEMGWKDPETNKRPMSHAFRILVLHHHLYPVEWALEPARDFPYSTCLDSVQIMHFAARNRINLIIHGHKHQFEFAQMCRWTDQKPYYHNILGMGSTSSTDVSRSHSNCIGILDFDQFNRLNIKILALSSEDAEKVTELFSYDIPIST